MQVTGFLALADRELGIVEVDGNAERLLRLPRNCKLDSSSAEHGESVVMSLCAWSSLVYLVVFDFQTTDNMKNY